MNKSVIVLALATITAPSLATEQYTDVNAPYLLGGYGVGSDETGISLTIGLPIHENWAMELTVHKNDDFDSHYQGSHSSDWLFVALTPTYKHHIENNFNMYVKGGLFYGHGDVNIEFLGDELNVKDDTFNLTFGTGFEYMQHEGFTARIGIDWYHVGSLTHQSFKHDIGTEKVVNIQLGYKF